jgi:hypothetical protein
MKASKITKQDQFNYYSSYCHNAGIKVNSHKFQLWYKLWLKGVKIPVNRFLYGNILFESMKEDIFNLLTDSEFTKLEIKYIKNLLF